MKAARIIVTVATLAGTALTLRADLANGIKAVVHDSVVTYEEVEGLTEQTSDVLRRDFRNEPETFTKKLNEMRAENLEKLLGQQLILHDFKTAGYNLPESIIDEEVQDRIRSRFGDETTLTKTLQAEGITREKFRQRIRDQFIVAALKQKNISSEIIISPHKVETYYLAHKDDYKLEDEVKLRMIVLKQGAGTGSESNPSSAQKMAEEIEGQLKKGVPFAEMATVYSEGSQKKEGGLMGWWERSRLNAGLADVAFSIPPGKPSGVMSRSAGDDYWIFQYDENGRPVQGRHYSVDSATKKEKLIEDRKFDNGALPSTVPPPEEFYLMMVDEKRTAHVKSLGEVRDQIEGDLLREEKGRLEKQWIERLRKKTFVRYF